MAVVTSVTADDKIRFIEGPLGTPRTSIGATHEITVEDFATSLGFADDLARQAEFMIVAIGDNTTAITTGDGKMEFYWPFDSTMVAYRATEITAGTGTSTIIDVNKNGTTTMTTNKLSIDATEKTSDTAATAHALTTTDWSSGDICTVDFDQVGTGAAGVQITFYFTRNP